jgi:hypothetical protein
LVHENVDHPGADPSSGRARQAVQTPYFGATAQQVHSAAARRRSAPRGWGDDDPLYQAALAVEKEHELASEMAEWEAATIEDGLGDGKNASQ